MKVILQTVLLVVVFVFVGLVGVGWYAVHHADRYLPRVIAYLQKKSGLQIKVQHVDVGVYPSLIVHAYGVQVKNPRPFPAGDFLNAPRVDAVVEEAPLILGKVVVRSLVLHEPMVDFISDPDGLWNFQNPSSSKQQSAHFSMGMISDLQIDNGSLLGSNLIDPADTPGPVILAVRHFSAHLRQVDFYRAVRSGSSEPVRGTLTATVARFGSIHTTDLHSDLRITRNQFTFRRFDAKTHSGHAEGDFSLIFGAKNTFFQTDLKVSGIGIPYLLAEFSHGPVQMTGMMQGDLKLAGEIEHTSNPLDSVHGTGHITIERGDFPSLNHDKSMVQMKRFRDKGTESLPPAAFSTFVTDMELHDRRLFSKRIGVNFYGIAVDGTGTTSVTGGGMNYKGVATIQNKQGFFTDMFASWFKGAQIRDGKMTFPVQISGTLAKPKFAIVH